MYSGSIANDDATVRFWKAVITRQPSSQVHVLIPGGVPISSSLDKRKPVMGEPMRLWESECEIPVHSPSSETLNEQFRRAESLRTDTREYMKNIHSLEGERGEGARVTERGRIYYPLCNYIYYPLC